MVVCVNAVAASLVVLRKVGDSSLSEWARRFVPLVAAASSAPCDGEGMHLGFLGCNRNVPDVKDEIEGDVTFLLVAVPWP